MTSSVVYMQYIACSAKIVCALLLCHYWCSDTSLQVFYLHAVTNDQPSFYLTWHSYHYNKTFFKFICNFLQEFWACFRAEPDKDRFSIDHGSRRHRHRVVCEGHSVAPIRWPRLIALLQRSVGGVLSLSLWIWSIHLERGPPGGRFHSRLGSLPSVRLTWHRSALWSGVSSWSLTIWPKTAFLQCDIMLASRRNCLVGPDEPMPLDL